MASALESRWEDRLNTWAEYMLSDRLGGRVKISSAYSLVGRGAPAEGDGIPIHVGEALDTDELYQKLAAHLRLAVWAWYCERGTVGQKAHDLSISADALAYRVKAAKHKLEELHGARYRGKQKAR